MWAKQHGRLITGVLVAFILTSQPSQAQYAANFQTNIISGVTSSWSGGYLVGSNTFADVLLVQNSGVLSSTLGYVGRAAISSNNSVLITGSGSSWNNSGDLIIGFQSTGNSLVISNGGQVADGNGDVGDEGASSSDNDVLVTGSGSVWTNRAGLLIGAPGAGPRNHLLITTGAHVFSNPSAFTGAGYVGEGSGTNSALVSGSGSVWSVNGGLFVGNSEPANSLTISNGGQVIDTSGTVGNNSGASNSTVLVTDPDSAWINNSSLSIGVSSAGNSLVISNSGQVSCSSGLIGSGAGASGNSVRVVNGGVWQNNALTVGGQGSSNSLVIAGGVVYATNLVVGAASATCDNVVQLNSGILNVTDANGDAVLEVRRGMFILNGGVLNVDRLVMTNACGLFVRHGGILNVTTLVLDPNLDADGDGVPNGWEQQYGLDPLNANDANKDADGDGLSNLQEYLAGTDPANKASDLHITSVARTGNDLTITWMMGSSRTNALQATGGGSFSTNNFADIFTVTNTIGTVTNYLDVGAATNNPSRYYRVRLVP